MTPLDDDALDRAERAERALLGMTLAILEGKSATTKFQRAAHRRALLASALDALEHLVAYSPVGDVCDQACEQLALNAGVQAVARAQRRRNQAREVRRRAAR